MKIKIGEKLPNGATLIASQPIPETRQYIVLAVWGFDPVECEYVTWRANEDGKCEEGRYFQAIELAAIGFGERCIDVCY